MDSLRKIGLVYSEKESILNFLREEEAMEREGLLKNWLACQDITIAFLDSVSESEFEKKPFEPRFTSFIWEFNCILTTRQKYINGFKEGQLDGDTNEGESVPDKREMKRRMKETARDIERLIETSGKNSLLFFGEETARDIVFSYLMQHEQLHFGKLMLYFAKAGLKQPDSLKEMWGMESFGKKA